MRGRIYRIRYFSSVSFHGVYAVWHFLRFYTGSLLYLVFYCGGFLFSVVCGILIKICQEKVCQETTVIS